jgi:hypothetical protein
VAIKSELDHERCATDAQQGTGYSRSSGCRQSERIPSARLFTAGRNLGCPVSNKSHLYPGLLALDKIFANRYAPFQLTDSIQVKGDGSLTSRCFNLASLIVPGNHLLALMRTTTISHAITRYSSLIDQPCFDTPVTLYCISLHASDHYPKLG